MIQLNYRDARPIYEQVKDGFRSMIIRGELRQDVKLPSVRELASSLDINPNTIQRAYRELEQEGYVYTVPGRGSFVVGRSEVDDLRRRDLWEALENNVEELLFLGVSWGEIVEHIREKGSNRTRKS